MPVDPRDKNTSTPPRSKLEAKRQEFSRALPLAQHILNLEGSVKVVTAAPTNDQAPQNYYDAVQLYVDSATTPTDMRVYFWLNKAKKWGYASLTIVT